MRKIQAFFSILLLNVLFAGAVSAQNQNSPGAGIYVKVYGGYGLLTPGSYLLYPSTTNNNSGSSTFNSSSIGLGAGLHYGGGIAYVASDFINIGIDAEYLSGKKLSSSNSYSYSNGSNSGNSLYSQTVTHSVLSIIPNVTFKALSKPGYYIYNRIGIVLAVNTKVQVVSTDTSNSASGGNAYTYGNLSNQTYKFGLNLGVQAAIGAQFNLTDNLRGFVEIVGNYLPTKPTSSKETSTTNAQTNGLPNAGTPSTSNYNYTYKKSGTFNNTSNPNSTNGYDYNYTAAPVTFNINYIGLNIGVAYKF
ncbi:MAG: hypothetical protein JST47_13325 [Bacteroidetes bacterium]|nr:hypothetical protein [Bacteroidota bacterium]MBS1974383.1 hypothetical protein [Bacteroidota bacterium]